MRHSRSVFLSLYGRFAELDLGHFQDTCNSVSIGMECFTVLRGFFVILLFIAAVRADCVVTRDAVEACLSRHTWTSVSICVLQKYTVNQLIDCVGFQNPVICNVPQDDDDPEILDRLDRNGDGKLCTSPRATLIYAANSTQGRSCGMTQIFKSCPRSSQSEAYRSCLCRREVCPEDISCLDNRFHRKNVEEGDLFKSRCAPALPSTCRPKATSGSLQTTSTSSSSSTTDTDGPASSTDAPASVSTSSTTRTQERTPTDTPSSSTSTSSLEALESTQSSTAATTTTAGNNSVHVRSNLAWAVLAVLGALVRTFWE